MKQSVAEHQEVPKEGATVMTVRGVRKQHRDRNLAMGYRQKQKERNQASCESRKRKTITGRMMTRCAAVAWLRRNVTRNQAEQGTLKQQKDGETVETSGMQQCHKGQMLKTASE
jgi:hypothetical protein